ncbi:MAG: M48 family metallopeptidase [Planctomycetota bacterium]|jgi:predicted Zn-dependent protease
MNLIVCTCLLSTISACGIFSGGIRTGDLNISVDLGLADGVWELILTDFALDVIDYTASSIADDIADGDVPDNLSPEQSYYFGRGVSAALVDKYGMANPKDKKVKVQLEYLNEMAGYLAYSGNFETALWSPVTVGILRSNEVAAFSTPGGFIWISMGAIKLCENEDQLASIIAHELGHAAMDHAVKAYVGSIRPSPWIKNLHKLSPMGTNLGSWIGSWSEQLIEDGYGEDQEYEADKWGAMTLSSAGYSADAMLHLLRRVERFEQKSKTPGLYLKNHPDIDDRIDEIVDLIDDVPDLSYEVSIKGKKGRTARFKATFR